MDHRDGRERSHVREDGVEKDSAAAAVELDGQTRPAVVAREVGRALWGRDLLGPGPGWWPWGAAARTRAQRRHDIAARAADRRRHLQRSLHHVLDRDTRTVRAPWRKMPLRRRAGVVVVLSGVVLAVIVLGLSRAPSADTSATHPAVGEVTTGPPGAASTVSSSAPTATTSPAVSLPKQSPVPPGGVAPRTVAPRTGLAPGDIVVVQAPSAAVSAEELAGPHEVAMAWLARWCPFDTGREQFGDAERRARQAMTGEAWTLFDPAADDRTRRSWDQAHAAGESAGCSAPLVQVVPSAPRTPDRVVVRVSAERVVTTGIGTRYVEHVSDTRVVLRRPDTTWRVDLATTGG